MDNKCLIQRHSASPPVKLQLKSHWSSLYPPDWKIFLNVWKALKIFYESIKQKKTKRRKRKKKGKTFYESIVVDLQLICVVTFCCPAKWWSYAYIYSFHYALSHTCWHIEYIPLCYTVAPLFSMHPIFNSWHLLAPNSLSFLPSS